MTKRRVLLLTALIALTALTACNPAYKRLGPEYGALPPCGVQTHVVSPRGEFSEAQKADIIAALAEIALWSNRDLVFAGEVDYRAETPNRPGHTVVVEHDSRYTGYALPNKFVKLGGWYMTFPSPSNGPVYGYATFKGVVEHELLHALVGAADMYNEPGGNPELLMGSGMLKRNTMNLGDVKAAQEGGCK